MPGKFLKVGALVESQAGTTVHGRRVAGGFTFPPSTELHNGACHSSSIPSQQLNSTPAISLGVSTWIELDGFSKAEIIPCGTEGRKENAVSLSCVWMSTASCFVSCPPKSFAWRWHLCVTYLCSITLPPGRQFCCLNSSFPSALYQEAALGKQYSVHVGFVSVL